MRKITQFKLACPVATTTQGAWVIPGRKPEPCSTPVLPPDPVYVTPAAPEAPAAELRLPNALLISNDAFQLNCADVQGAGPFGSPVVIPAGTVTGTLVWTDIPGVTPAQLDYLASLTPEVFANINSEASADLIQSLTRLTAAQAGYVQGRVHILEQEIAEETYANALAQLRCVWRNTTQTATCQNPDAARTDQSDGATAAGVVNPGVCPAGTYDSLVSQAEANALALADARSRLVCLVGNDPINLTCRDIGYPTDIPSDPEGVSFDGRRRVGSVHVPADQFFAASKQEANSNARRSAESQLSCFYVNQALQVSCADVNAELAAAWVDPVDYDSRRSGNPVQVQLGRFVSEGPSASQADADAQARAMATALLHCTFKNTRQIVRCQPQVLNDLTYPPRDPDREVIVEAGEVEAASQEAADELAVQLGLLQLGCVFCNPYIPPSCYPPDYVVPVSGVIPAEAVTSDWSEDVVLGVAAGTVCDADPLQAAALATAVALKRPVVYDKGCQYSNDAMWFGCLQSLGNTPLPPGGYHHPDYSRNSPLPAGYESVPFEDQLSVLSSPSPKPPPGVLPYIVIPAGAYPVNSKDVPGNMSPKAYANQMARLQGLSLLRCVFTNPEMALNCQTAYSPEKFVQEDVAKDNNQVVTTVIPAGRHESYSSFRDAVNAARSEAQSLLNCYYENPEMKVRCWRQFGTPGSYPELMPLESTPSLLVFGDGQAKRYWQAGGVQHSEDVQLFNWQTGSLGTPVVVQRGAFTSLISLADARRQALDYGVASLDCTAQALDTNVCNDPMLMFCGALVDPNPGVPYKPGVNQVPQGKEWKVNEKGILVVGDGHNYTVNKAGLQVDLGCSTDPVGGCNGTGLQIPPCLVAAATREEANRLAILMMRGTLDCVGSADPPDLGGGGSGPPGPPGSSAPQTGCTGPCLAVYS